LLLKIFELFYCIIKIKIYLFDQFGNNNKLCKKNKKKIKIFEQFVKKKKLSKKKKKKTSMLLDCVLSFLSKKEKTLERINLQHL
jgi:hypothetical protein